MGRLEISVGDPTSPDVEALVARHLAFARAHTAPEHVHALGSQALGQPDLTLFCARCDDRLVAIGALGELDATHGELKSMHTAAETRRRGIGRAMVAHLLAVAGRRGYSRVSLETGAGDAFAGARALYARAGFVPCGAFGAYPDVPTSVFMTKRLASPPPDAAWPT